MYHFNLNFPYLFRVVVQEGQLLISNPASPSCRSWPLCQSSVSLSLAESLERFLISHFTQTHLRVIDFSFSECKMDFLSFIPERRSWRAVASNLMEVFVKRSLSWAPFHKVLILLQVWKYVITWFVLDVAEEVQVSYLCLNAALGFPLQLT